MGEGSEKGTRVEAWAGDESAHGGRGPGCLLARGFQAKGWKERCSWQGSFVSCGEPWRCLRGIWTLDSREPLKALEQGSMVSNKLAFLAG